MHRREFLQHACAAAAASLLAACAPAAPLLAPTPSAPSPTPTPAAGLKPVVLLEGLDFPEGPAFDPQGRLWCTELGSGNLVLWDGQQARRFATQGKPNGLAFDRQGRAWVPDSGQNAIRRFDPRNETWETVLDQVDGKALQSPNDLCFDSAGNLLFTCPNFASEERLGYVVCLSPDGGARKIAEGYYRPNGLDVVDGGKALVVADTYQKKLFKGGWDAQERRWLDPQHWAEVGGSEGPDGMAFGADGRLYQAIYGDGLVRVIDGQGQTVDKLALPGNNPTNAAIDPSGKLGLVVTETERGLLLSLPWVRPGAAIFDGGEAWQ